LDRFQSYQDLISIIYSYGKYYPKKHGNWILLPYTETAWMEMDSWNKKITVFEGFPGDVEGERAYWVGFSRDCENRRTLGIHFGSKDCVEDIDFYLENVKKIYKIH